MDYIRDFGAHIRGGAGLLKRPSRRREPDGAHRPRRSRQRRVALQASASLEPMPYSFRVSAPDMHRFSSETRRGAVVGGRRGVPAGISS